MNIVVIILLLLLPNMLRLVIISLREVYIFNIDVQGNVRVWDTTPGGENILKSETKAFSGRINDLDWDHESILF